MKSKTTKTKSTLPPATKILFRFTLGTEEIGGRTIEDLVRCDAFAGELIAELIAGDPEDSSPFYFEVDHLVEKILVPADAEARPEARRAIIEYFGKPGRKCTTPEDAADEILRSITFEHGRAGFLLGFAAAMRLQQTVGGAR